MVLSLLKTTEFSQRPKCWGNYMNCSICEKYEFCKAKQPRNGYELRRICSVCEKCVFADSCSLNTLASLGLTMQKIGEK